MHKQNIHPFTHTCIKRTSFETCNCKSIQLAQSDSHSISIFWWHILCFAPVGSRQRSGACTDRTAAGSESPPGRSWCTRSPAERAAWERSDPQEPCGNECPATDSGGYVRLLKLIKNCWKFWLHHRNILRLNRYSSVIKPTIQWAPASSFSKFSYPETEEINQTPENLSHSLISSSETQDNTHRCEVRWTDQLQTITNIVHRPTRKETHLMRHNTLFLQIIYL